ncbi:MAG: T9SS type A sorting domain-containing protein, partial [Bacteroidota bacterium]
LAADTILLQISTVPSISINAPVTTFCSGDSTTVTATVSGMGNSFLGWEYTQALGQTPSFFSSDTSITVKDSGYYISMAANASGCIARDTLRITLLPKPLGTISTPGNTLCNTGGSITLSGPAGMNLYLWSTGNTGPNNIATVTGIYTLTVEDAAGCLSDPDSIEIKTGPNLGLTRSLNIISSTCSTANANVAFTPYGGIAPYRYTWQDGATSANRSFNTPGQYFVVVSDTNGCANQDTVNIPGSSIVVSDFLLSPDFGNNEGGILLQPSGGTAPYTASWFISGTLALKDSGLSATTGGISYYGYEVEDNAGCIYRGTAALPYATAVYPGDCNHDQLVDMNDLLEIGLHFNKTGPARPNASLTWTPQVAPLWNDTLLNGKDIRHVDTDGNGTISQPDTLAIIQNFGNTHVNQKNGDGPGPKVFLTIPASTYNPGDTMIATINMGTMDTTAVDVYGLTFDLTYDTSLVEQNSVSQSFNTSWLGTKNVDMLTLSQNDAPNGIIYTGIVRNDMATRTGHGKIGELIVVIDDHLAKRTWPLVLDIINVNAIDENGNPLPISGLPTEVTVSTSTTSLTATSKDTGWKLAPNPTSNRVLVEVRQDVSGAVFIVQDATGRLVLTHPLNDQQQLSVALDGLGAGTYFAHVEGKSYLSSTKKLVIVR